MWDKAQFYILVICLPYVTAGHNAAAAEPQSTKVSFVKPSFEFRRLDPKQSPDPLFAYNGHVWFVSFFLCAMHSYNFVVL